MVSQQKRKDQLAKQHQGLSPKSALTLWRLYMDL